MGAVSEDDKQTRDKSMRTAADRAIVLLLSRYSMIAVIPLIGVIATLSGVIGTRMLMAINDGIKEAKDSAVLARDTAAQARAELTGAISDLRNTLTANVGALNLINSRLDAQGRRIDGHDAEIDRLRERMYGGGSPPGPVRK